MKVDDMNRRDFLHRGSVLTALAGLAGCLGSAADGSAPENRDQSPDDRTTDETTTEGESDTDFSGLRSDDEEPFRTIAVGSREEVVFPDNNRPREVRVWNDADAIREISLRVVREGEPVLDRTVAFAADAYLTVVVNEPADYRIGVGLAGADATTFELSRESFDCNSAMTDVGVLTDGRIETISMSTAMGCPGPEVADADFSTGEGACGTDHRAAVDFVGERVRVDGAVRTATPRANLALAEANYDRETGALTVRVRASQSDDSDMGTQCVGEVPYETTVDFDHDLPSKVMVVHETPEETVTVTRVERP